MRLITFLWLLLISTSLWAETYSGAIKLERGAFFEERKPEIEYAGDIEYTVTFFVDEFIDSEAIYAYTRVKNPTTEMLKVVFYAAFLDADGNLVATSSHSTKLTPGVETQLGGLYSEVADGEWEKVTSYKYTVTRL